MIRHLPRLVPLDPGRPEMSEERRPIREVTRQVAFDAGRWTAERKANVNALFDDLAAEWNDRPHARRFEAVDDAVARGGPFPPGLAVEIGAGTGLLTARLAEAFTPLVAVDLSAAMLALVPAPTPRIRADAARLPLATGSVAVLAAVNMFLFSAEVDRVLAADGVLLWVNSLAEETPIHLSGDDIDAALPGMWEGAASEAGWGSWATFRRAL
ncbi:MAG TPA: methyltransferase domain-containing protein [Acidimicrobiales bacterium]|nr:methyltransferase domain-containing protein [Acidimicrobiales bacterium]